MMNVGRSMSEIEDRVHKLVNAVSQQWTYACHQNSQWYQLHVPYLELKMSARNKIGSTYVKDYSDLYRQSAFAQSHSVALPFWAESARELVKTWYETVFPDEEEPHVDNDNSAFREEDH